MTTMVNERSLTVDEVAAYFGVSGWTVRGWLRTGKLRGYRPGGRKVGWRIRESALQAFIERQEDIAEAETTTQPESDGEQ